MAQVQKPIFDTDMSDVKLFKRQRSYASGYANPVWKILIEGQKMPKII